LLACELRLGRFAGPFTLFCIPQGAKLSQAGASGMGALQSLNEGAGSDSDRGSLCGVLAERLPGQNREVNPMDAEHYLQAAEAAGRVKWLAKFEGDELLGRAGALIVDEQECIAVLLEDGTLPANPQLRPGQVVKYQHSSKVGGPIILDSANLRGDKPD
jgi:hypothetical protein